MKINWRTIGIFAGAILLLLAGCYFLFHENRIEVKPTALIFKEKGESSSHKIEIRNSTGSYTIKYNSTDNYIIEELRDKKINYGLAENIFSRVLDLEGTALTNTQIKDQDLFGFDKPQVIVSLSFDNGTKQQLIIGSKSSAEDRYFAMKKTDHVIYLLESDIVEELKKNIDVYENKMLLDFSLESDYEKLSEVTLSGSDIITVKLKKKKDEFCMIKPIAYPCMQENLKEKFLNPLMHLKGDKNTNQKKSKEMGFEDPQYSIELLYEEKMIQILIGKTIGKFTFITRTDVGTVYLINKDKLEFLKTDYRKLIGEYVYYRSIAQITFIRIEYENKKYELNIEKNGGSYEVRMGSQSDAVNDTVSGFLPLINAVSSLPRIGIASEKDGLKGEINIMILLKDGRKENLILSKKNEREYDVSVNGICEFTTSSSSVAFIIEKINQLWK